MDASERHVRVEDVMTRSVITVTPETGFQDLIAAMAEHRVSAVPVIEDDRLVGIVSEADLLREGAGDRRRTRALDWFLHPGRAEDARARGHDARAIMSASVVTVRPHTSVWEAIRMLRDAGVKRLPVVDDEGRLVGIVSRVDLLGAFVHTDEDLAARVRSVLSTVLATELQRVEVAVREGHVALSGSIDLAAQRDVLLDAVRDIPGVLDVEDRIEVADEAGAGVPFAPIQPPGEDTGPRVDV